MSISKAIGARIKRAREAKGYSGARLAELARLRPEQVSRYEHGRVTPGLDALRRIAEASGVTVDALLRDLEAAAPTSTPPEAA